jgi:hypothetical protein
MLCLAEMTEQCENNEDIKYSNKAAWFKVSGYCTFYQSDNVDQRPMYYMACKICKKKVAEDNNGYRCENCNKSFGDAVPTYNF